MSLNRRYFWLKLKDDFFTSKRIKKLRSIAGGDTFVIIYLKMQLLALKTDGVITYNGLEDDFAAELALDLDEKEDDVRFVLNYLLNVNLLETSDNINFFLPYVAENTGSETASTQRSRDYRAKQKVLQCNANATQMQRKCNANATLMQQSATLMQQKCNGEKEIEIEIEIDKDKEIELDDDDNNNINIYNSASEKLFNRLDPKEQAEIKKYWEWERLIKLVAERTQNIEITDPFKYIITVAEKEQWEKVR